MAKDRKLWYRWGKLGPAWKTLACRGIANRRSTGGEPDYICDGDHIERAPGDDLYSWEWWYRTGKAPDDIS